MGVARRCPQVTASAPCPSSVDAEIRRAGSERWPVLASLFGRAFVTEPMLRWPLGEHDQVEERFIRCFEYFLEDGRLRHRARSGRCRRCGDLDPRRAQGCIRRGADAAEDARADRGRRTPVRCVLVVGRGAAHARAAVASRLGRGRAEAAGARAWPRPDRARARSRAGRRLRSAARDRNRRNVPLYERVGFTTYFAADAPEDGPHIWFMRWDP